MGLLMKPLNCRFSHDRNKDAVKSDIAALIKKKGVDAHVHWTSAYALRVDVAKVIKIAGTIEDSCITISGDVLRPFAKRLDKELESILQDLPWLRREG